MNRSFWKTYWPPLAWAAVLFIQSSIPYARTPLKLTQWDDKWIHALIYFPLGFLLMRSLQQSHTQRSTAMLLLLAFLLGTTYGLSDELHQYFVPGRFSDWRDAVADAVGVALGSVGYLKYEQRRRKRHKP
jgi:VanZ family protein